MIGQMPLWAGMGRARRSRLWRGGVPRRRWL